MLMLAINRLNLKLLVGQINETKTHQNRLKILRQWLFCRRQQFTLRDYFAVSYL